MILYDNISKRDINGGVIMASAVREGILLVCSECKNQNYSVDKNKKLHPDRFEIKKYCKHCQKKTLHKEKK